MDLHRKWLFRQGSVAGVATRACMGSMQCARLLEPESGERRLGAKGEQIVDTVLLHVR